MSKVYSEEVVYNYHLAGLMSTSTDNLREIVRKWKRKSTLRKLLSMLTPVIDPDMELLEIEVAQDLIVAREDPNSEAARRVNWRLDFYRQMEVNKELYPEKRTRFYS